MNVRKRNWYVEGGEKVFGEVWVVQSDYEATTCMSGTLDVLDRRYHVLVSQHDEVLDKSFSHIRGETSVIIEQEA